jgi:hypothetical protein
MATQFAQDTQQYTQTVEIPPEYQKHAKVFDKEASNRFPPSRSWDHAIELKADAPRAIDCKVYPMTPTEDESLVKFLKDMQERGYIQSSKSPYTSSFFFIWKKDSKLQPVQDYRKLNQWTIPNRYPLPLIPELIARVKDAEIFSKVDVRQGYNNVRIKEGDEHKAAFKTKYSLFEPLVMFFGLRNSPSTFQAMMDQDIVEEHRLLGTEIIIYMDDILIASRSLEGHRRAVHGILTHLEDLDLYLKPEKCTWEASSVDYLGLILEKGVTHMDPAKIKGIANWPTPATVKQVQSFLGFCDFYRPFIHHFSHIAWPLNELTQKEVPWTWEEHHQKAFKELRNKVTSEPVLAQPPQSATPTEELEVRYSFRMQQNLIDPMFVLRTTLTRPSRGPPTIPIRSRTASPHSSDSSSEAPSPQPFYIMNNVPATTTDPLTIPIPHTNSISPIPMPPRLDNLGGILDHTRGLRQEPLGSGKDDQEATAILSDPRAAEGWGWVDADTDTHSGQEADTEHLCSISEQWTPPPDGYSYNLGDQYIPMPIWGPDGHIWPTKFTKVEYTNNPTVHGFCTGSPTPYSDHLYATPFFDLWQRPRYAVADIWFLSTWYPYRDEVDLGIKALGDQTIQAEVRWYHGHEYHLNRLQNELTELENRISTWQMEKDQCICRLEQADALQRIHEANNQNITEARIRVVELLQDLESGRSSWKGGNVAFFAYHTVLTDYQWDCLIFSFVIHSPLTHRLWLIPILLMTRY